MTQIPKPPPTLEEVWREGHTPIEGASLPPLPQGGMGKRKILGTLECCACGEIVYVAMSPDGSNITYRCLYCGAVVTVECADQTGEDNMGTEKVCSTISVKTELPVPPPARDLYEDEDGAERGNWLWGICKEWGWTVFAFIAVTGLLFALQIVIIRGHTYTYVVMSNGYMYSAVCINELGVSHVIGGPYATFDEAESVRRRECGEWTVVSPVAEQELAK